MRKLWKSVKGYTIIEIVVTFAIIAIVFGIGVVSYSAIFKNATQTYYHTLERSLLLSGSDYFQDHRELLPANSYSTVSIQALVEEKYTDEVKDKNGNTCLNGEVIIYKGENNKYQYEVCLKCGDYESTGEYCSGYADDERRVKVPTSALCKGKARATYTGKEMSLTIVEHGLGFVLSGNRQTNANESDGYLITAILNDDYTWSDDTIEPKTFHCKLYKKKPTIELIPYQGNVVKLGTTSFKEKAEIPGTFNNTNKVATIASIESVNTISNRENDITVKGLAIGTGEIGVTFEPADAYKNNYTSITGEDDINYLVKVQSGITPPTSSYCKTDLVYNGSEQVLTKNPGTGFTFKNNKGTDAMTYKVVAKLSDGYLWDDNTSRDIEIDCSIKQKELNLLWESLSLTYNGLSQGPKVTANTGITGERIELTTTEEIYVGNYEATVSCQRVIGGRQKCENYSLENPTKPYQITTKNISFKAKEQTIKYGESITTGLDQVSVSSGGLVQNDKLASIQLSQSSIYHTDSGKVIKVSNAIIHNEDDVDVTNNYNITYDNTGSLTINKRNITVKAKNQTITYGDSIAAGVEQLDISGDGLAFDDILLASIYISQPNNMVAGANISMTVTNAVVKDKNATKELTGNYNITYDNTGKLTINKREVVPTISSCSNKVYNGNDTTSCTITLANVVAADSSQVTASGSCKFDSRHVGNNKLVTCTGITLSGNKSNNYQISSENKTKTGTANITAKDVTATISCSGKTYDGTNSANCSVTNTFPKANTSDNVSWRVGTCTFNNKNKGNNKTITCSIIIEGNQKDNYSAGNVTSSGNITQKTITTSVSCGSKDYDGNTTANCSGGTTLSGVIAGDSVSSSLGNCNFNNKKAGDGKTVTCSVTLSGADKDNYSITSPTTTANITKKPISTTITCNNKPYDGSTTANCSGGTSLSGVITGDSVSSTKGSCNFNNKKAGDGKTVTCSVTLSGADKDNYSITSPTTTADITKKTISTTITCNNKPYDGNTTANCSGGTSLSGVIGGDIVSSTKGSCTFDNKNAGTEKIVTCSVTISGTDKDNYSITSPTTTASITAKELTTTVSCEEKSYNGNTTANCSGGTTLSGVIGGDIVSSTISSCTFDNKNAGTGKTVTCAIALSGANKNNYTVKSATTTATITKKIITTNVSCGEKTYNGNATATCDGGTTLSGVIGGDSVSSTRGSCVFDNKNVGTGKTVTCTVTLSGTDKDNYSIEAPTTTANINPKSLTTTISCQGKEYDGSTTANCTGGTSLTGVIGGDSVTATKGNCNFNNKTVSEGKTVTCSVTLSGTDKDNYSITQPTTTANITQKPLTTSVTCQNKEYDGTKTATCSGGTTLSGVVSGDSVTSTKGNCTFNTTNADDGKTVTCTVTLSGTDKDNYSIAAPTTTANINPKSLTIKADNKTMSYGESAPNYTYTASGFVTGESVSDLSGSISYIVKRNNTVINNVSTASAGSSYKIIPSGFSSSNYTISYQEGTLTISKIPAEITCYDRSINPYTGANQTIAKCTGCTTSFNASRKDVGTYTISGTGDSNHTDPSSKSCEIIPVSLTITAVNKSMYYGASAPDYSISASGFVASESFSNLSGSISYTIKKNGTIISNVSTSNVGSYIIAPSGYTSSNYNISYYNGTLTINKAASVCPTLTSYSGYADGNSYTIGVSGGSGYTSLNYRTSLTGSWVTTQPSSSTVGTTTVYVKTIGDDNHEDNSECGSATITLENNKCTNGTWSYTGLYTYNDTGCGNCNSMGNNLATGTTCWETIAQPYGCSPNLGGQTFPSMPSSSQCNGGTGIEWNYCIPSATNGTWTDGTRYCVQKKYVCRQKEYNCP